MSGGGESSAFPAPAGAPMVIAAAQRHLIERSRRPPADWSCTEEVVGEDDDVGPEEPRGEPPPPRARSSTLHDLDDGYGAVDELQRWRHVRVLPQPVEGGAIEVAAG